MNAKNITPILNVSDMAASFAWFGKWGWRKLWDWGTPREMHVRHADGHVLRVSKGIAE
jgi:hypothetical protein